MLLREDFYTILRETIIDYARTVLGKEVTCKYESFDGAETWCINATLGFISRVPTPEGVRTYMKSEYNVRGSVLKYLLGKVGVDVITAFPYMGMTRKLYVSAGVFDKPVFIVPQNRSIRFYNYETMEVDCIIKSGFTSKYFDNQAQFRSSYHYDFLNPILAKGEGWFREPVLTGHPLVRTTCKTMFENGMKQAFDYLRILANDTFEWTSTRKYVASLKEDALQKTALAKDKKKIHEVSATLHLLDIADYLSTCLDDMIPTCISHGDFQAGNIWVEPDGRTLLYDWETAGRRSVWYDSATLSYSLRRAYGWETMLNSTDMEGLMRCVPNGFDVKVERRGVLGVLLMEDILFYLDDMLELPNDWGRDSYDAFILNVKNLNWEL